jgi:hypothetical protein
VLILAMLVSAAREKRQARPWPPPGRAAVTVVVGSGVFLLFVWVFQTLATGDKGALPSALAGGGVLLGVVVVGFALLSALDRLVREKGRRKPWMEESSD